MEIPLLYQLTKYGQEGLKVPIRGCEVAEKLNPYSSLLDFLPSTNTTALSEPLSIEKQPLTHSKLHNFIQSGFDLTEFGINEGSRVSLLLPNGPELAVAIMSVISKWCAAPINPTNTWEEIKSELDSTKSVAILILAGVSTNENALKAAKVNNLKVIVLTPSAITSGLFRMSTLNPIDRSISDLSVNSLNDVHIHVSSKSNIVSKYRSYSSLIILMILFEYFSFYLYSSVIAYLWYLRK